MRIKVYFYAYPKVTAILPYLHGNNKQSHQNTIAFSGICKTIQKCENNKMPDLVNAHKSHKYAGFALYDSFEKGKIDI